MSELSDIETRLEAVEQDVARLKRLLGGASPPRPWYQPLIGSMKDFPEFDEVVRFGREMGKAERDYSEPTD